MDQEKKQSETVYRWNYDLQEAENKKNDTRTRTRSAVTFAVVMTLVFAIFLSVLGAVLAVVWRNGGGSAVNVVTPGDVTAVAESVSPATVLITGSSAAGVGYGTGFFLRSDGYIATNYHVIAGFEDELTVTLYQGRTMEAKVIGYYDIADLAVIKIEGTGYPVAPIGDSDALHVGETAVAVGNPGGVDASWSTSSGIISALDRIITVDDVAKGMIAELRMIQTTAPLNPGNSGGPLCNGRGEVIGIATRKMSEYEGIGLCIPINGAMELLNAIMENGNADGVVSKVSRARPTIGITCGSVVEGAHVYGKEYNLVAEATGILVSTVERGSGAYQKLLPGDIITAMDGITVTDLSEMTELLYRYRRGDRVVFTVQRESLVIELTVSLGVDLE